MKNNIFINASEILSEDLDNIVYSDKKEEYQNIPYLNNWKTILPDPPLNISKSTKKDLIELSKLSTVRNEQTVNDVLMVDKDVSNIFIPILNKFNLRFPEKLVNSFWSMYYPLVMNLKYYFNRARPWQLAPKYGIVIDVIKSDSIKTPSYPSGHSAYGYMLENILSNMYPLHRNDFIIAAENVNMARKIQGVHYQSDIDASRKLTTVVFPKIIDYLINKGA